MGWKNHGEPSSGLKSTDMEITGGAVEYFKSNLGEEVAGGRPRRREVDRVKVIFTADEKKRIQEDRVK